MVPLKKISEPLTKFRLIYLIIDSIQQTANFRPVLMPIISKFRDIHERGCETMGIVSRPDVS